MKTRGIIGKKIIGVRQQMIHRGKAYNPTNAVVAILLNDGTELRPVVAEDDGCYHVDFVRAKR